MRIALDVMGADAPPMEIIRGGVRAAEKSRDTEIILVGDRETVQQALSEISPSPGASLTVHHADEIIAMGEAPGKAVRRKPRSSLVQAVDLVARHEADAVVSPGNTGAVVAAAMLHRMGLLAGVKRPGIAVNVRHPEGGSPSTLIDCGATLDCKPTHLYQFAFMAAMYQSRVLGVDRPTVGLLSVGEEDTKGSSLIKEVSAMLAASPLNFIGNVEGGAVVQHVCNVVVCDGFVGNAILKAAEAVAVSFVNFIRSRARMSWRVRVGLWLARELIEDMREIFDRTEYGGAPLLGVDGTVLICHGRSDARTIMNAIGAAGDTVRSDVNGHIVAALAESASGEPLSRAVGNSE